MLTETPTMLKHKYGRECIQVTMNNLKKTEFSVKDIGYNQAFLDLIKQDDLMKIETLEASLEEVFIQVTGTNLKI